MNKKKAEKHSAHSGSNSSSDGSLGSVESQSSLESEELDEALMSFGEPLHVSISHATTRFQTIQHAHSLQPGEEEAKVGGGGQFDLKKWLSRRQAAEGPPFAKRFGLVFSDLDIYGTDVSNRHIATLITPIWKLIKGVRNGYGIFQLLTGMGNKRQLIHSVSGEVKEGEMLLVLGRPGSGCSTLLRVLGNHRKTYTKIDGYISYGGLSPKEVLRSYRGEVAYNQEDDLHFPTLTVRKTLEFAIKCKTPSRQVLRDSSAFQRDVLQMLYDMYGLGGCADTIVGNAFLRGVSGGERKRVSIAEQVAIGASVEIWDNSTRGLDASSALDYVRSLRINADTLQKAEVATIYQASESIYKLFDKVMVLDNGRQLYFGPTTEAVEYFERLGMYKPPRQTTSDFLTGLTKLSERRVRSGWEERVPKTALEFEQKWHQSPEYHKMRQNVKEFSTHIIENDRGQELRELIDRTKMGTKRLRMRRKSPYTTTFLLQFYMLLVREWEIFIGTPTAIIFKAIYNIAFAIIVGTLFIRLPQNTSSFFTRGGVLFFSLLFNSLTSMSEIPKSVSGRLVVYKHKALAMYHPAALSLAQTVVDMPFMLFQVIVFGSILYWATSLQPYGGQFLAFLLYLCIGFLCMTAFFRLIGNISPNVDVGHTLSGLSLLFLILYVGYLIPPPLMHHYFKWIYWINPLAYGFKALLSNEYRNIRYPCDPRNLVPQGPGISIANQVCTVTGANAGMLTVKGRDYLERGYSIHVVDQWKDFLAVTSFWILFVFLIAGVMEFVEFGNTGYSVNVYKRFRPNVNDLIAESTLQGEEEEEEQNIYANIPSDGPTEEQIAQGTTYTWNQVNYTVPIKGGERQLLNNISGYIKPGTMTALMGSSGAGKTTLLDALSQRKTIGKLEGEMLMNGAEQPPSFCRITGYCEQLDVHNPHATVREALRFSAALRRSPSVSTNELSGGYTVYFGDIGNDAQTLISYFERNGAEKCAAENNPAEYILDVVGNKAAGIDWPKIWEDSPEETQVLNEISRINNIKQNNAANTEEDVDNESSRKYARLLPFQFKIVAGRMMRSHWRNLQYNLTRVGLQITCALAVGFSFIHVGDGVADTQNKIFAIFQTAVLSVLVINQVQPQFLRQRLYYSRESSTNQYGWEAFSASIILTELPFAIFSNTVFFVCFYWLVGLASPANRVGYFYIIYIVLGIFSVTLGQAIAAFSPNDIIASMLNPIFTTMMTLFCGVTIPYLEMPLFWRRWMYYLSPYTYFIEGVITNELHEMPIRCKGRDLFNFNIPNGETCASFAGNWLSSSNGYVRKLDQTGFCEYCPYKFGDEYYANLNWSFVHRWRNFCILIGFIVFNIFFTVLMIKLYKVNKR
ncbi:hypothetical protein COEREDRAFT_99317 [Coemansia reversa NRRL 1564]|uniref:ABC transporter domain-containing protein n=1 Tax=Coemansia reversa (strain ATCC 12441 / NRRL 1564) TaxID=763665 RepID=A0A2G5B481_COERN|nr:hypothetical protein COEREDRAFT_99317 [Coemansia reversa NRRL 1564]|eukprot:PIA13810.1 hypothetical protein COEREDRAFT_99317 [Coemansia reversa NRRL 1564]